MAQIIHPYKVGEPGSALLTEVAVNINTATTTAVIAAGAAGIIIRVYKLFLVAAAAQTLDIKDGSTSLTGGALTFAAGGVLALDNDGTPWFTATAATALNFVTTTTGQLSGRLYYMKA